MPSTVTNYTISINPDAEIPPDAIAQIMDKLADLQPVLLDQIATYLAQTQQDNFESAGGVFGTWPPLAASTLSEKHRLGYPAQPLVRTGRLASSIGQDIVLSRDGVSVGINTDEVPYARYHDAGGARLPQRVLVSVTPAMLERMLAILTAFVSEIAGDSTLKVTLS